MTKINAQIVGTLAHMAMSAQAEAARTQPAFEIDPELPNRICIERNSRFYMSAAQFVGVRIDGEEATNVVEYCVKGGWARIGKIGADGKLIHNSRFEAETTVRNGVIEPYWKLRPSRQIRRAMARIG